MTRNALALILALFVGTATASEQNDTKRTAAQIQAEIDKLQLELQNALKTEWPERTGEVNTQTKKEILCSMFQDFPKMLVQHRYAEALHMAQQAKAISPDDATLRVMEDVALQIYTIRLKHAKPQEETADNEQQSEQSDFDWSKISRAATDNIFQRLEKPIVLNVDTVLPLEEAIKNLCEQVGIPVQVDTVSLREANISPDTPVNLPQGNGIHLKMKTVLNLILDQLDLAYVLKRNMLHITTKRQAQEDLVVKVYFVGDIENHGSLVDIIPAFIAADSWVHKGQSGEGELKIYPNTMSVAIRQTEEIHTQVENFLTEVREINDMRQAEKKIIYGVELIR